MLGYFVVFERDKGDDREEKQYLWREGVKVVTRGMGKLFFSLHIHDEDASVFGLGHELISRRLCLLTG